MSAATPGRAAYDPLPDIAALVRAGFDYDTIGANIHAERIAENLGLTDEDDGTDDYRPSMVDADTALVGLREALAAPEPHAAAGEVVHLSPPGDAGVTPCCGQTPFDLARTDRMANDPSLVTCGGPEPQPAPGLADLRERLARAERDRNAARNVVAEMHAHWQRDGATPEQEELFPQWLAAAGLTDGATAEPQPAPDLGTAWRLLDEARERMAAIAGERDRLRQALVLLADDGNLEAAGSLNQIEPAGLPS